MRNKKVFLSGLALLALVPFLAVSFAFAENQRPEDSQQDRRNEMREERAEKDSGKENRVAALKKLMQNQISRSERALSRLEDIIEKIESRREKMALVEGADLTAVDKMIADAKEQYEEAATALDEAKADLAAIDGSAEIKGAVKVFMGSMKDLKKQLIELHKTLKATVKEMRKAVPTAKKEETEAETEENSSPESN